MQGRSRNREIRRLSRRNGGGGRRRRNAVVLRTTPRGHCSESQTQIQPPVAHAGVCKGDCMGNRVGGLRLGNSGFQIVQQRGPARNERRAERCPPTR